MVIKHTAAIVRGPMGFSILTFDSSDHQRKPEALVVPAAESKRSVDRLALHAGGHLQPEHASSKRRHFATGTYDGVVSQPARGQARAMR